MSLQMINPLKHWMMEFHVLEENDKSENGKELFLNIFSKLNMRELVSATHVNKTWRKVILNNLKVLFHLKLLPSLNDNSRLLKEAVFARKTVSSFIDSDFYLVGEDHLSKRCLDFQSRLITRLAIYHKVIVIYEAPNKKAVDTSKEFYMEYYDICPSLKEKVSFEGWDVDDVFRDGLPDYLYEKKQEHLKRFKKGIVDIQEKINGICPDPSNSDFLSLEALKLITKLLEYKKIYTSKVEDLTSELKKGIMSDEAIKKRFPERTASMVNVLNRVQQTIASGDFDGKVVLICGMAHLITLQHDIGVEEYRLDKLYDALRQLKSIIMIPKEI